MHPRRAKPRLAVIGATGTGKSAFAVKLALFLRSCGQPVEIVNCDAMQLYRGMDIGTAKISAREQQGIPHHLLSTFSPSENVSVAEYQEKASEVIAEIESRAAVPLIVGGSGLYFNALVYGFHFPGSDEQIRAKLQKRYEEEGLDALVDTLVKQDADADAKIDIQNPRRVIRALEILELTGKPMASKLPENPKPVHPTVIFGLREERNILIERLDSRVQEMWKNGLLGEVRSLLTANSVLGRTARCAIGYAQAIAQLHGEMDQEEAIAQTQQLTRRYARRQVSWFKRLADVHWMGSEEAANADGVRDAGRLWARAALGDAGQGEQLAGEFGEQVHAAGLRSAPAGAVPAVEAASLLSAGAEKIEPLRETDGMHSALTGAREQDARLLNTVSLGQNEMVLMRSCAATVFALINTAGSQEKTGRNCRDLAAHTPQNTPVAHHAHTRETQAAPPASLTNTLSPPSGAISHPHSNHLSAAHTTVTCEQRENRSLTRTLQKLCREHFAQEADLYVQIEPVTNTPKSQKIHKNASAIYGGYPEVFPNWEITHISSGFPTETESETKELLTPLRCASFALVHLGYETPERRETIPLRLGGTVYDTLLGSAGVSVDTGIWNPRGDRVTIAQSEYFCRTASKKERLAWFEMKKREDRELCDQTENTEICERKTTNTEIHAAKYVNCVASKPETVQNCLEPETGKKQKQNLFVVHSDRREKILLLEEEITVQDGIGQVHPRKISMTAPGRFTAEEILASAFFARFLSPHRKLQYWKVWADKEAIAVRMFYAEEGEHLSQSAAVQLLQVSSPERLIFRRYPIHDKDTQNSAENSTEAVRNS